MSSKDVPYPQKVRSGVHSKSEPRILLWDLDGTLACWSDPVGLTFSLARCWLHHLGKMADNHQSLGKPVAMLLPRAVLAAAKGFRRLLVNQGPLSNDLLFNRTVGASLGWTIDQVASVTRALLDDSTQAEIQGRFIRVIPEALTLVGRLASSQRFRQVVATNPVMPSAFNRQRLARAGYRPEWFEFVSGSEFFIGQKIDARFYRDMLARLGAAPEDCLMIGDHPRKDGVAREVGIPVFLLKTSYVKPRPAIPGLEPTATGDYASLERMLTTLHDGGSFHG